MARKIKDESITDIVMIKKFILDTLKTWIFEIENGNCTDETIKHIHYVISREIDTKVSKKDIGIIFSKSDIEVNNTISRNLLSKYKDQTKRYSFNAIYNLFKR